MPIKPIDTFITNGVKLFEANPSQTIISITYCPKHSKSSSSVVHDTKKNNKKTRVAFKINNSHISSHYKFTTNKSKEVSRLLNAIGPRGVSISSNKIEKKLKNIKKINSKQLVGLSTLLVNTKVKEYIPQSPSTIKSNSNKDNNNNNNNNQGSKDSSNKKNKKKNKKRR